MVRIGWHAACVGNVAISALLDQPLLSQYGTLLFNGHELVAFEAKGFEVFDIPKKLRVAAMRNAVVGM
jgi:hypothetical protein